jgi:peptide-methionine (R)-S-oxide reductase
MPPSFPVQKTEAEWQALLAEKIAAGLAEPLAFEVTRRARTERAFTGRYEHQWAPGAYHCVCCGQALFAPGHQFNSGCGWPSFDQALPGAIAEVTDHSHGMVRVETVCSRCGAHLGHVFEDGPTDTGLRYCMNSAALTHAPTPPDPDAR